MTTPSVTMMRLELAGIVFIVFLGSFLHFTFELSGNNPVVALFSAVNESVWEHLKLAFWPAVMYIIIELVYIRSPPSSFFPAKAISILSMPTLIVIMYYLSKLFVEESLVIDIFIFVLAVVIGQALSIKLMSTEAFPRTLTLSAWALVFVLAFAFMYFTFYPPHVSPFQDPASSGYGIVE
jgi:hypothetical protein